MKSSSTALESINEPKSAQAIVRSPDKAISGNLRKHIIETTTYNFSINISSNLANALAIRYLGFDIVSLGILTSLRTLSASFGSILGLPLIYRFRCRRLLLWLVFGSINRVGWALLILSIFLPPPWSFIYMVLVVAVVQAAGSIAGLASADTLADMVKPSMAARFFGSVGSLNNIASLLALVVTMAVFKFYDTNSAYALLYSIALVSVLISLQNITSNAIASVASSLGAWMASTVGVPTVFLTSTMLRSAVAATSIKALPELKLERP